MQELIVFTDLDGTLLDEADYSFAGALPALDRIKKLGIPLIITTSKTRAEIIPLQRTLGLCDPFIAENGGGIFFPGEAADPMRMNSQTERGEGIRLGIPYARIRSFLAALPPSIRVRGFGDLSNREVAALADLNPEAAALAKTREFTEPFLIEDPSMLPLIEERASQAGLQVVRGGRFHHLMGKDQDKGRAVQILRQHLAEREGHRTTAIGLGDSENDRPLLTAVDLPVLIPRPDGSFLDAPLPGLVRATEPGSRGWNEAVLRLLDRYSASGRPFAGRQSVQPSSIIKEETP